MLLRRRGSLLGRGLARGRIVGEMAGEDGALLLSVFRVLVVVVVSLIRAVMK